MRLLLLLATFVYTTAFSQERKYSVGVSYGKYTAPDIPHTNIPLDSNNSVSKNYVSAHFAYRTGRKISIMTSFLSGKFDYFEDTRSNAWDEPTKYKKGTTNARGYDSHAYLTLSYDIIDVNNKFKTSVGTGLGVIIRRLKYPYREPCSSGCAVFIGEFSTMRLSVPLSAKSYILVKDRVGVGLNLGGFLDEEFKIFGLHVGPEIHIKL